MIEWEQITPELKKLDKNRKLGMIIAGVAAVLMVFSVPKEVEADFLSKFVVTLLIWLFGTQPLVSGFLHTKILRQKPFMKSLLKFPNILFYGIEIWIIIQGIAIYSGYFFGIADIVKLIVKKPLVYKWDIQAEQEKILEAEREADRNRVYMIQPAGYCTKCGAPYAVDSVVCAKCGTKITNQNANISQ
ncbi:MAG: zinc ribbon domain-containing protein [Oscillospiraceae bacterium]|nr:zinc ribbon domain-containing protein [Oscillospiraceae bacterium]